MEENKPLSINEILSERKLAEWLCLQYNEDTNRSRNLGYMVSRGLPCVEIGANRFFFAKDVIDFFWRRRKCKSVVASEQG